MAIVTSVTLVLDVRRVDSDTTGLFLGGLVYLRIVGETRGTLFRENLGDGRRQGGLPVVDVTYATNTDEEKRHSK